MLEKRQKCYILSFFDQHQVSIEEHISCCALPEDQRLDDV